VPAVIAALALAGCAPEPTPPRGPCPPLDWVVYAPTGSLDRFSKVVALPDGDFVVGGLGTWVKMGTGPDDWAPSNAPNARLVARLGPDGRARWMHGVGGADATVNQTFTIANGVVWVAGSEDGAGGVRLDTGLLPEAPPVGVAAGDHDGFLAGFDLATGDWARTVFIGGPGKQLAVGMAVDPDGNVYGVGEYNHAPLDLGAAVPLPWPWPGLDIHDPTVDQIQNTWLASWGPDGALRWAVASFGPTTGDQLGWAEGQLLWTTVNAQLWYPDGGPRGTVATVASDGYSSDVFVVDPTTGAVSAATTGVRSSNLQLSDFGDRSPSGALMAGAFVNHPAAWTPPGEPSVELTYRPSIITVSASGQVTGLLPVPIATMGGGDLSSRAFAGLLGGETGYYPDAFLTNEDFGFASTDALHVDGVAGWLDEAGATECSWAFSADSVTWATDATRDARGGFVVVGWFENSDLTVYGPDGDVVAVLDRVDGSPSEDAFAIRFGWPDEP
jgi:hypothetical protein